MTDQWEIKFTGTRSNVAEIRKLVGRMQNMDGDVDVSLLYKERAPGPYKVWQEKWHRWTELKPGDVLYNVGNLYVPKYGMVPDIRVVV